VSTDPPARPAPLMEQAPYYAKAFSPIIGRCFRLVSRQDQQAGPIHCPEPPRWRGSFRARNGRHYAVEACDGHRAPLTNVRPSPLGRRMGP